VTQNDIIRMAREAGFTDYYPERLTRFFNLAFAAGVKHGLEEAARVCEKLTPTDADGVCPVADVIRNLIK